MKALLIMYDGPDARKFTQHLEGRGYEVTRVDTIKEARERFRKDFSTYERFSFGGAECSLAEVLDTSVLVPPIQREDARSQRTGSFKRTKVLRK